MNSSSAPKIYFYCYPPQPRADGSYIKAYHFYQHPLVCLGEGLQQLGIPFYSNINYWRLSQQEDNYLFRHQSDVTPDDCDVVVFDNIFLLSGGFPKCLFHSKQKYKTVYINITDETPAKGAFADEFRQFDLVLKAHMCHQGYYPANFRPWAFALTNRIIEATQDIPDFISRQHKMLVNWRHHQHPHTLRKYVEKYFLPKIEPYLPLDTSIDAGLDPMDVSDEVFQNPERAMELLQQAQSSGRHFPSYYQRLKTTAACACFGGYFISSWPADQSSFLSKNLRRVLTKTHMKSNRLLQWDSWRLWEAMAAGAVVFHLDFDKYGFQLPHQPQNWKHYVGIDLDNINESLERIHDNPQLLAYISKAGRDWALAHYAPKPMTMYFLKLLDYAPQSSRRDLNAVS